MLIDKATLSLLKPNNKHVKEKNVIIEYCTPKHRHCLKMKRRKKVGLYIYSMACLIVGQNIEESRNDSIRT